MAEEIDKGKVLISRDERMKPIEINELGTFQIPKFDNMLGASEKPVVWISKHGVMDGKKGNPNKDGEYKWYEFLSGQTVNYFNFPFFMMCKYECEIAGVPS